MPAFAPAPRELEGAAVGEAGGGVLDAEGDKLLVEDVEGVEGVEDVEDEVVLLVEEVVEVDVAELDAPCCVRDCGGGA